MKHCTRTLAAATLRSVRIALLLIVRACLAQTTITTDRPAVTDSSAVVPAGIFQAENGFLDTAVSTGHTQDFPESLIRYGLTSSTELRLTVPDYFTGMRSGFGDLELGVKQQLINDAGGFQVAAIVSLSLPTGASAISSHGYDPSFQLPWSRKLSTNWTAAGMLSIYVPTENGKHQVIGESTFLMDRQLTKACDAFVEYVGDFPESGGPSHLLHFGTAYKITDQQQLDLHVGVGLSSAAVDHFIGFGYSFAFRIPRP
jgi:hypothetical protein